MIVVSDTSPVSYLHRIGRLTLLKDLYGRVLIPPAVRDELKAALGLHDTLEWSVFEVIPPESSENVQDFGSELDLGESEAIVLAVAFLWAVGADSAPARTAGGSWAPA